MKKGNTWPKTVLPVLGAGLALALSACAPAATDSPDAGASGGDADAGAQMGSCSTNDFGETEQVAASYVDDAGQVLFVGTGTIYGLMQVRVAPSVQPGTYDLSEITDPATADIQFLAGDRCVQGEGCEKFFTATEGSIEIVAAGAGGERLAFTMNNVTMSEITSPSNFTLVDGGESYCAHGLSHDEVLAVPPARVNDEVRDFDLVNCASEQTESFHSIASDTETVWVIAVAGWCSACKQWVPQVQSTIENVADSKAKVIFVLGENQFGNEPTLEYCREYADSEYGEDGTRWYKDFTGTSFANTFGSLYIYPDAQGRFGLPWNAVVLGSADDYTYYYADGSGGNLNAVLQERL